MASADPPPEPREPVLPGPLLLGQASSDPSPDVGPAVRPGPRRHGWPWLAWVVITGIVLLVLLRGHFGGPWRQALAEPKDAGLRTADLSLRYLIGANDVFGPLGGDLYPQAQTMLAGSVEQRLRLVVLAGELRAPAEALAVLEELSQEDRKGWTSRQTQAVVVLRKLYQHYQSNEFDAPSVAPEERRLVQRELGWAGALALHPSAGPDPARRAELIAEARSTFLVVFGGALVMLVLAAIGLLALLVILLLVWLGRLRGGIGPPSGTGGLYAETFALYLILFLGLSVALAFLPLPEPRFLWLGLPALLSLTALAWPVLWGVPWVQVREEIGLTAGRLPWLEPLLGIVTYVLAMPLLGFAVVVTLILAQIQRWFQGLPDGGPVQVPAHPVVETITRAGWWELLQVFFLASVIAPLVEETMFRGVLYRHLREAGRTLPTAVNVFLSATLVGFVFAVIHPYGLLGVPLLMALSYAFTVAREWRGSLIPCMIAHGIQNGVALLMARLLLAGG